MMKKKKGHNWKARQNVEATVIENPSEKVKNLKFNHLLSISIDKKVYIQYLIVSFRYNEIRKVMQTLIFLLQNLKFISCNFLSK